MGKYVQAIIIIYVLQNQNPYFIIISKHKLYFPISPLYIDSYLVLPFKFPMTTLVLLFGTDLCAVYIIPWNHSLKISSFLLFVPTQSY
jgi:hypothetical protein